MYSAIYYNLYTASSVTMQGRQANATAALFFEQFLANNVPFESLDELMVFINNVRTETRYYDDYQLGIRMIPLEECFFKLLYNCGFDWIPNYDEMEILWKVLSQLNQVELNRLYYKNNLYEFMENSVATNLLLKCLSELEEPFLDPNSPPNIIKEDLDALRDLLHEYVFYKHQINSKIAKMDALIRYVSIIQDTDSAIISFDAFYQWALRKTYGVPMRIKQTYYDLSEEKVDEISYVPDYDFFNDEIIETKRWVRPIVLIPQDGLRHSIICIIAYCCGIMLNEYVDQMVRNFGANRPGPCRLTLKNEFTFKRLLINTLAKKHYASKVELQEGNVIPENGKADLDIKGMEAFVKSTMNPTVQAKLKKILYEDILKPDNIDQVAVIKGIAMIENEIFNSIQNGEKIYYKPAKIRSAGSYEAPMMIQGVKASVAYNALHEPGTEAIDTTIRNSLDIVKVEINRRNIETIKDDFPGVYQRTIQLMDSVSQFKSGIDSIAIPLNEPVPKWVLPFVRYSEIINDNVAKFPLESIGIFRGNATNNTSNLIAF